MSANSSMLLIGIGTAGARIARGVSRAYGDDLRFTIADTDASSGEGGGDFTLLGGDRLSGRGSRIMVCSPAQKRMPSRIITTIPALPHQFQKRS